jgi:excinuclease ABC subunit B
MKFTLKSDYSPQGDQPQAINKLSQGVFDGERFQTLLGVTGSGKTFTMANVIEKVQKPTLIVSHNKTLAAQLYQEFREFFPDNSVNYFVSYYDYYQPESYLPSSDTYIEKESQINDQVERLRHAATSSLLSRPDTIIVSSVSCIYGIGSPEDYGNMAFALEVGATVPRDDLIRSLIAIQYSRNDIDFKPGSFRAKGDVVEIHLPGEKKIVKLSFWGDTIETISLHEYKDTYLQQLPAVYVEYYRIFPATHWISTRDKIESMIPLIQAEMEQQRDYFKSINKLIEAQRIEERTNFDIEMMKEVGYTKGIENYSRYMAGRAPGEPPYTLIDYFLEADQDFLLMVDESHISLPQFRGMYAGDAARKRNLIDYGFRLPSAADNRPLKFDEFETKIKHGIFVSATPSEYELQKSSDGKISTLLDVNEHGTKNTRIAEQIIRPTGLLEPTIEIRPTATQIEDIIETIHTNTAEGHRTLVLTLTKRMAEDLSEHFKDADILAEYLHSEIDTMKRPEILNNLRKGQFDVLIGINLLREGLDLPEVSLVAILDADKEGFLRNERSLIQTIGRAARHQEGHVILYADRITGSIERAMTETTRRRSIQEEYNAEHGITPQTIKKSIRDDMVTDKQEEVRKKKFELIDDEEREILLSDLTKRMQEAAANLDFEEAAKLRDEVEKLKAMKKE